MKTTFTLGIGIAAIVASVVIVTQYLSVTTPPAPLYISHSPRPTATATPSLTPIATPTPVASTSQGPTPIATLPGTLTNIWSANARAKAKFLASFQTSPDGKFKITFDSAEDGNTTHIVDSKGNGVASHAGSFLGWSPDSKKILLFLSEAQNEIDRVVYYLGIDGKSQDSGLPAGVGDAAISPVDGSILYSSTGGTSGKGGLYIRDTKGNDRFLVSGSPDYDTWFAWSPKGNKIAYIRTECDTNPHSACYGTLTVINSDGTGLGEISQIDTDVYPPMWSKDGTRLTFTNKEFVWEFNLGNPPTSTSSSTMIPVSIPSGWKTWTDTTYNYQISYPPTFYLNGGGTDMTISSFDPSTYQHAGIDGSNISININVYPEFSFIADSLPAWRDGMSLMESVTTTLSGETAIRGKTKDDQVPYFSGNVIVAHNDTGYQLGYYPNDSKYVPILEQMLKTFRFTK